MSERQPPPEESAPLEYERVKQRERNLPRVLLVVAILLLLIVAGVAAWFFVGVSPQRVGPSGSPTRVTPAPSPG